MDGTSKYSEPRTGEENVDPAQFRGDHILMKWAPGNKVVFYRPLNINIIFPMFFLILGAGLLWLIFYVAQAPNVDTLPILILLIFGCFLGGMGLYGCYNYLPRTVVFDWAQSNVTCASLLKKKVIPFSRISEILLKGRRQGGRFWQTYPLYRVQMEIVDQSDANALSLLLSIKSDYFDTFDLALERWMPILDGLARTLNLQGRVIDDRGKVILRR